MRVLVVLVVAMVGVAWAQVSSTAPPNVGNCGPLLLPYRPVPTNIVVKDNTTQQVVQELRNDMSIKVEVDVPAGTTEVHCLLGMGIGIKYQPMGQCETVTAREGKATCVLRINGVRATRDENLELRIAYTVPSDPRPVRTTYTGLSFKYEGLRAATTTTTKAPKTTTTHSTLTEPPKVDDPHDSKMEAYLAAKWAEQQQKMAEDEDRDSEGEWQKLELEEKRKHDEEVQKELEEYEARKAEENRRREEMIRREMMDKEENERIEDEFKRKSTPQPTARPDSGEERVEEEEVDVNENGIVVDSGVAGLGPVLVLVVSMLVAILI